MLPRLNLCGTRVPSRGAGLLAGPHTRVSSPPHPRPSRGGATGVDPHGCPLPGTGLQRGRTRGVPPWALTSASRTSKVFWHLVKASGFHLWFQLKKQISLRNRWWYWRGRWDAAGGGTGFLPPSPVQQRGPASSRGESTAEHQEGSGSPCLLYTAAGQKGHRGGSKTNEISGPEKGPISAESAWEWNELSGGQKKGEVFYC